MDLFTEKIEDWASWSRVFQNKEAFSSLAKRILEQNALPFKTLESLTPGTNAVFKSGGLVVKIFAPRQSGIGGDDACEREVKALLHAKKQGVPCSRPVAYGRIEDRYSFAYIVSEYVGAKEAGSAFAAMSGDRKVRFALRLKEIMALFNTPCDDGYGIDLYAQTVANTRFKGMDEGFLQELFQVAKKAAAEPYVYVHGDLTAQNVLITDSGEPYIIDFGDACLAPVFYEYPPVVLDLMAMDKAMVSEFFKAKDPDKAVFDIIKGISLHDFGGNIIRDMCRLTGRKADFKSIEELFYHLKKELF